ncbi:MAG: SGNH/GDSL hydrolase family protein [Bacteroidota bacterium]
MKKTSILLLAFIAFACGSNHLTKVKNTSKNEFIEWSNTWLVNTDKSDLPRVLIIGDSHVERYYPLVSDKLKGKAYCSKFTTSKSLGDPAILIQLKTVLYNNKIDIISFNNGLHGVNYSDKEYSSYISKVYKIFKKSNPDLKVIWVNTTARRVKGSLNEYDQYNPGVINRNKAVDTFTKTKNIPVVDLYSLSNTHPEYYENDGIHLNKTGVEEEAKAVSDTIIKVIEKAFIK